MWHDRIFNHLRQRLAFRRTPCWHAERGEMCLQCRFADLYEYTCHITLIINKGMSQLPVGNQESRASRWAPPPFRTGFFNGGWCSAAANQRRIHLSIKVGWDQQHQQHSHSRYSKKGKLDSAQWSKEGTHTERDGGVGGAHLTASRAHAYCSIVCSARDHLYSALKWLIRRLTYSIMWQNL